MPFSMPSIPGSFSTDASDPHDTINKLRAHAESAAKIGNPEEASAFHAKAKSMTEKHGEPPSKPENQLEKFEPFDNDTILSNHYRPTRHETVQYDINEHLRQHGFEPVSREFKPNQMPHGKERQRGEFNGSNHFDKFIHPQGHSAEYRGGHRMGETKVSHEHEIKTKDGKVYKGQTPEQMKSNLVSSGITGRKTAHRWFHSPLDKEGPKYV